MKDDIKPFSILLGIAAATAIAIKVTQRPEHLSLVCLIVILIAVANLVYACREDADGRDKLAAGLTGYVALIAGTRWLVARAPNLEVFFRTPGTVAPVALAVIAAVILIPIALTALNARRADELKSTGSTQRRVRERPAIPHRPTSDRPEGDAERRERIAAELRAKRKAITPPSAPETGSGSQPD